MNPQYLRMSFPGDGYDRWQRGIFAGRPFRLKGSQPSIAFHSLQEQESGVKLRKLRTVGYQSRGKDGRWGEEKRKAEEDRGEERQQSTLSGSRKTAPRTEATGREGKRKGPWRH